MGTARESRPSEIIFNQIWMQMQGLAVCVWKPMTENAIETINQIRTDLDKLKQRLKDEADNGKKDEDSQA